MSSGTSPAPLPEPESGIAIKDHHRNKVFMSKNTPKDPKLTPGLSDPGLTRWTRLLNKIDKDPDAALEDPRCLTPYFLDRYFDLCDGKALEAPYVAKDYAKIAIELAKRTGDRHQMNRASGVAVHAFIGNSQWQLAAEVLEGYKHHALACCQVCASDWLRRYGDLLVEAADPKDAYIFLELSAQVLGDQLDDDARGRILFLRGIAYHFLGECGRALDAAGTALTLLSLSTPRGYFLDATAFLACFLEFNRERRYDEQALVLLDRFGQRLKGLRRWEEVCARVHWVEGQLHARLDHPRRARRRLERARKAHLKRAPHHWALAIGVDEALVYCRHNRPELYDYSVRRIITACANDLKLDAKLSGRLEKLCELLQETPYYADTILSQFRRSFKTPVPGLMVDLNAPGTLQRQWPYGPTSAAAG